MHYTILKCYGNQQYIDTGLAAAAVINNKYRFKYTGVCSHSMHSSSCLVSNKSLLSSYFSHLQQKSGKTRNTINTS